MKGQCPGGMSCVHYCWSAVLQGTTSGSVQATDRLLKELREIYRSDNFKHGILHLVSLSLCGSSHTSCYVRC